ncbi:hypothetical protein ZWY2020_053054 [Hordeum vulgare]|nr:hypothetical protein ZWY2020_053054 [Hordeum vulgare]
MLYMADDLLQSAEEQNCSNQEDKDPLGSAEEEHQQHGQRSSSRLFFRYPERPMSLPECRLTSVLANSERNMAHNNEAGGSGKAFWELSQEMEEEPRRYEDAAVDTDPEYTTPSGVGDDTTDGVTEDATTDDGSTRTDGSQSKRQRKDRRPNVLNTVKEEFTEVNSDGYPTTPIEIVKGYAVQLGCILRSTISINTENLRHKDRGNLRNLLFTKLHERYKFPDDVANTRLSRNKVNSAALTKMSKALSTWRSAVKRMIDKGDSYEKIKAKNPSISEDDYMEFKIKCESKATAESSQWGKEMWELNLGSTNSVPAVTEWRNLYGTRRTRSVSSKAYHPASGNTVTSRPGTMSGPGADTDVPCTLLHFVGGELIDVTKGRIVQPGNPMFNGKPMTPTTYRVQLVRVLPGCDDLLPPFDPAGADKDDVMTLSACLSWPLLWPKRHIRLGAGDTTPQTTPRVVPAPSHGKTAATLPDMHMAQDPDMYMAQDPDDNDDDGTFTKDDKYFAEHGYGEEFLGPPSQEPNPAKDDRKLAGTAEKPNCNRRCLAFSFEETPPSAAFTEPQIAKVQNIISPNTLKKVVSEQNSIPLHQQKKGRKRKTNKGASQPAPSTIRALDGPPSPKDISRRVHVAGRPMLPTNLLNAATGAMRSLHDSVLCLEKRRLLGRARDRQVASSYLEGVILANSDKDNFLVPYFPW